MSVVMRPRFYLWVTFALVAVVVLGFFRTYYSRVLAFDPPPLPTVIQIHAVVFTVWLGLFLTQVGVGGRDRGGLPRKLGIFSAIFAILVFTVGLLATFQTAISNHVSPSGLLPPQFSIIGFTSIGMFAVFIALGVAYRKRPALHRRFMVLGMIASISPATARLMKLFHANDLRDVLIPLCAGLFVAACMVHDWRKHRVVHPVYVVGGLVIMVSWPLRLMVGHSAWYFPIGEGVARLAHRMFG